MSNGLNDWLKFWSQNDVATKQFSIASQWNDIIKSKSFTESLSIPSMLSQMSKAASINIDIFRATKGLDYLSNSSFLNFHKNLFVPDKVVSTIVSIISKQNDFYERLNNTFNKPINYNPILSVNYNNLQFALNGISGQVAALSAYQKNWGLLDDFERINNEALSISESVIEQEITEELKIRLQKLVEQILAFLKSNKKFALNALFFISVIVNFMNIHQYVDFLKEKPEAVTKQDLKDLQITIIKEVSTKLKEQKEYRITRVRCSVMLKPKLRTIVVDSLPVDFEVVVLQTYHKWVFVTYIDVESNLPQTGWILKKYLDIP